MPIAPLGQTSGGVPAADVQRFRAVWSGYGAGGLSWWSWQATPAAMWSTLATDPGPPVAVTDPGWPTLGKGAKGDLVVWLQQHLASADPSVPVDGALGTLTLHGAAQLPARARHPADRHDRRRDVGGRPGPADGGEGLDGALTQLLYGAGTIRIQGLGVSQPSG